MLSTRDEHARPEVSYPRLQLPKLELCFASGSCLWLRQINNDPLVRLIEHEGQTTAVDLRDLCPSLEADFYKAKPIDRPATIFFSLRQQFRTVDAFLEAVRAMPRRQRQAAHQHVAEVH